MAERRWILFYDYVGDIVVRREPHRDAHLARIHAAVADGRVLAAGALGDPPTGAAIVFAPAGPEAAAAAAADAWAAEDPYVLAGLVTARRVVPWTVVAAAG